MNQVAMRKPPERHDAVCGELVAMAEREMAAFFRAVTELFGSEQAEISAEDWLHELMTMRDVPMNDTRATAGQWRQFTINALARLASRVNAASASIA